MRTSPLLVFGTGSLVLLLASASHGAIYYIDDSGSTNATGSTVAYSPAASWAILTNPSNAFSYGPGYHYENSGTSKPRTATFTFGGPTGLYYVYAGWAPAAPEYRTQDGTITAYGLTATVAAYPVNHEKQADGTTAPSNCRASGFFPIQSGSSQQPVQLGSGSTIVYSDGTEADPNQRTSADVVVFSTDLLIDNISTLTTASAAYAQNWNQYTNKLGEYSYGYHLAGSPTSGDIFEYDLGAALGSGPAQTKELRVSWLANNTGRDQDVTYRVTHTAGTTDIAINQRQDASGAAVSGPAWSGFRSLGTFELDGSSKLELIPSGSGSVCADTIALRCTLPRNRPGLVADFDGGYTPAEVDAYPGKAGGGWVSPWQLSSTSAMVADVESFNAIDGPCDPYLTVAGTSAGDKAVRRQYGSLGELSPTKPHKIRWKWRFDGDMDDMDVFVNRIHFFGNGTPTAGTSASLSWLISWTAQAGTTYDVPDRVWWFFDGTSGTGYDEDNMVATPIGLEAGVVYEFEVELFPDSGTYNASISNGTESFAAYGLTFRNQQTGAFTWIHFGGSMADGADWAFSLDSITIWVPEPASMTLLLLCGAAVLAPLRRRRR